MDWDEDGRKDLILGERDGYIRIYLNTNTDADPVFNGYAYLQLNGTTYDIGYTSAPYIIDWNNDGKKDVICGEDGGYVYLLVNTGTNAAPVFTTAVRIKNGTGDLKVSSRAAPVAFDWDHDGKKDLLVGDTNGNIAFFPNVGTDEAPVFDGSSLLQADGVNIDVENYARLDVVDWDEDGLEDIMCGCRGNTVTGGIWYFHALFMPAPDAKVNGDDGPINVPKTTPLEFKIALDPGSLDGVQHDWWVWIEKGYFNKWWCQYNSGSKKWTKNVTPIRFAGAALQQVNGYKVLGPRTIPAGSYYFRFAIDEKNDEYEGTFFDEVEITTY